MKIPFVSFAPVNNQIRSEIFDSFNRFFEDGQYILGANVKEFERSYAEYNKTDFFIGVSNGLDALYLSLKALEIGNGDEVILPANTFIATALAVEATGARIILAEPEESTSNIDAQKIEEKITDKTKAIIPVHLYGRPCKMNQILEIANHYKLHVVEDNAQAHGAQTEGKKTGSFGVLAATSFYPGKNLGAFGDAGGISLSSSELNNKIRLLRNYGSVVKYKHEIKGYNMRMDEIQAVFLNIKLKYLDNWTKQRINIAKQYLKELNNIEEIILPLTEKNNKHVYHLFVIHIKKRDEMAAFLEKKGISTGIHYPVPIHLQPAFKNSGYIKNDFPITEKLAETTLSLPLYPGLKEEEIHYICNCIKSFYGA